MVMIIPDWQYINKKRMKSVVQDRGMVSPLYLLNYKYKRRIRTGIGLLLGKASFAMIISDGVSQEEVRAIAKTFEQEQAQWYWSRLLRIYERGECDERSTWGGEDIYIDLPRSGGAVALWRSSHSRWITLADILSKDKRVLDLITAFFINAKFPSLLQEAVRFIKAMCFLVMS